MVSLKERATTVVKRDGDGGGEDWQRSLFKAWDQSSEQDLTYEGGIKLHTMNFYFVQPSVLDKVRYTRAA